MANLVTFVKKLWKDATSGGTPITAAELNRMEGGINDCATQINKLGDSVSLLDEGVCIRTGYISSELSTIRVKGAAWQAYLVLGQSGTLAIVDARGDGKPTVTAVSGLSITAEKGSENNAVDITINAGSTSFVIVSARSFTVSLR